MKEKENLNVKVQEEILEPIPEMSEEKVVSKIMEEGEILTEWEPMQGIGISPMAATIPVTSVTLSTNTLELKTSQTYQLKATLCPTCPTNKDLTWTSLNPDVATVNSSGLVTAKKPGGASIRLVAAGGGDPTSCFVTVVPMPVTRVEICGKPLTVKLDGSYTPTACVYPTNAYDKGVTWSLDGKTTSDIITISSSGNITAKKSGSEKIKVTTKDGGHTDTCTVTVENTNVKQYPLNTTEVTMPSQSNIDSYDLTCYAVQRDTMAACSDGAPVEYKNANPGYTDIGNHQFTTSVTVESKAINACTTNYIVIPGKKDDGVYRYDRLKGSVAAIVKYNDAGTAVEKVVYAIIGEVGPEKQKFLGEISLHTIWELEGNTSCTGTRGLNTGKYKAMVFFDTKQSWKQANLQQQINTAGEKYYNMIKNKVANYSV